MSEQIKDGGPAFPQTEPNAEIVNDERLTIYRGMTLRDYFAAAALQGLLAKEGSTAELAFIGFAECAYNYADAMLKARNAK